MIQIYRLTHGLGDKSVFSVPGYFRITESPIIYYNYNKPIRNTKFILNKLVSGLCTKTRAPIC